MNVNSLELSISHTGLGDKETFLVQPDRSNIVKYSAMADRVA